MIAEILSNNQIDIFFQPIVSLRACKLIGFEALLRVKNSEQEFYAPEFLFKKAKEENLILELDRKCREVAVQKFKPLFDKHPDTLLFLNIDTSILNFELVGSGKILELIKSAGLLPGNVVLDIADSYDADANALMQFAMIHKKHGFLIAIDDFGAGYSNLIHIAQYMPDIIKIDNQLIHGIHFDHKKKQMLKFICELSVNIGTLVLAEGVEQYEEMLEVYGYGGDLCQGNYLASASTIDEIDIQSIEKKLPSCLEHAQEAQINKLHKSGRRIIKFQEMVSNLAVGLENKDRKDLTDALLDLRLEIDGCECLYVISSNGVQLTETVMTISNENLRPKSLYEVASLGAQHTYKDYYYVPMRSGLKIYTTNPYVSKATGNVGRTISVMFDSKWNEKCLLCADILE